MNSKRRGVPSSDPERVARRDFVAEMQALAAAGGTEVAPPVLSAEELMEKTKKVENDFSAALNMAEESINRKVEEVEEEVEIENVMDHGSRGFVPERWIRTLNNVKHPEARLIVFHGIGQSHQYFTKWGEHFEGSHIALHAVCLPGRAHRTKDPTCGVVDAAQSIVRCIETFVEKEIWGNVALYLFGHCLGGIIAFEVAKILNESYDEKDHHNSNILCQHLVISSAKAPQTLTESNKDKYSKKWWMQSDSDLMDRAASLGGVPVVLRDKHRRDLFRMFVPCIRADFNAYEKYIYVPMERKNPDDEGSIDCPITCFGTEDDKALSTKEEMKEWSHATDYGSNAGEKNHSYHFLMGGHTWMNIVSKERVIKIFLEQLCSGFEPHLEMPEEDEEEYEREYNTFYGKFN